MTLMKRDRIGLFLRALGTLPNGYVLVPDTPAPKGVCWRQGPSLARCTLPRFHDGECTWNRKKP
jgi:hypothetical protein